MRPVLDHVLLTGALALLGATLAVAGTRVESAAAGVAFTKPDAWVIALAEPSSKDAKPVRRDDAELAQTMAQQTSPPVVAISRHPEPTPDLNAGFQITLRTLGKLEGQSATRILTGILPTLEAVSPDFKVTTPVTAITVGGRPAARIGYEHRLDFGENVSFRTHSDLIVVPRGQLMIQIGMGRKPQDPEAAADLERTLQSVEIAP
jgi:hypothetical protein